MLTPLTQQREPDLSFVQRTARTIARHIVTGTLVIQESTTFPGTTDDIPGPILETSGLKLGTDIFLGFSPEREDPGNKDFHTASIPKIVAGSGPEASAMDINVWEVIDTRNAMARRDLSCIHIHKVLTLRDQSMPPLCIRQEC